MERYCKDCGKLKEDYVFISSAVYGKTMCDPNSPSSIGVC